MTGRYRVVTPAPVWDEIIAIHKRIARDSPLNTSGFVAKLIERMERLDEAPGAAPEVGRSRSTGAPVHKVIEKPYLIYYRFHEQAREVIVLTVRHGHRRQPRRFE